MQLGGPFPSPGGGDVHHSEETIKTLLLLFDFGK